MKLVALSFFAGALALTACSHDTPSITMHGESSDGVPLEIHEADCVAFSRTTPSGGRQLSVGFADGPYSFSFETSKGDPASWEEDLPAPGRSRLLLDVLQDVAPLARTYRFGNGPGLFAPPGARCQVYTAESGGRANGGIACTALPSFTRYDNTYAPSKPTLDVVLAYDCPVFSLSD